MKPLALVLLLSVSGINCYSQSAKYSIVRKSEQLADANTELRCWIVRNQSGDSISLGSMEYHDWPSPKFFFLKNDLAVYEWGDEIKRTINVHDLKSNKILFTTEGVYPVLDSQNEVVLFYHRKELLVLDLNSLKTKELLTVDVLDFDYPKISIEESTRQISVNGKTLRY